MKLNQYIVIKQVLYELCFNNFKNTKIYPENAKNPQYGKSVLGKKYFKLASFLPINKTKNI